jgi:hypothetical protein
MAYCRIVLLGLRGRSFVGGSLVREVVRRVLYLSRCQACIATLIPKGHGLLVVGRDFEMNQEWHPVCWL